MRSPKFKGKRMLSEAMIRRSLIIYAILFLAVVSFASEKKPKALSDIDTIKQTLNSRTNGNDPYYSKVLSPAQSLELDKSKSDRIQSANDLLNTEMAAVITAFKGASEDKKVEAVNQAAAKFDGDLVKNGGAHIVFTDSNPSAAVARTMLMIPKKLKAGLNSAQIFNILTSYKHSAKPSDFLYEYADANNLTSGIVKNTTGSDETWKGDAAGQPFSLKQNFVLKKCRQLLGWRCVTSFYRADSFLKAADATNLLFIAIYDLQNNPDHPDFANDKRSNNQITGSSALYIVKESADWVMLYGVDSQWNNGKLSFQGAIQSEFKKDFDRFKERISYDLKVQL
jgi:hypothetical protein